MNANCLGGNCHSGATDVNTKLDLSTWEAMTKGSVYFNEVIPFNAAKSHFFGHINTNKDLGPIITPTMPFARDPLSQHGFGGTDFFGMSCWPQMAHRFGNVQTARQ